MLFGSFHFAHTNIEFKISRSDYSCILALRQPLFDVFDDYRELFAQNSCKDEQPIKRRLTIPYEIRPYKSKFHSKSFVASKSLHPRKVGLRKRRHYDCAMTPNILCSVKHWRRARGYTPSEPPDICLRNVLIFAWRKGKGL